MSEGWDICCVGQQIVTAVGKNGSSFIFRAMKSMEILKSKSV